MKKNIVWLIVAAVLLAGMIAALVLINKAPENGAESSSAPQETIYVTGNESAPFPAGIEITNDTGSFTVINRAAGTEAGDKASDLTIAGFENLSLDVYGLNALATNTATLTAKRIVSDNPSSEDISAYGLDAPRAVAKADGGSVTLLFGADAPGGEGVYVQRQGGNTVYLVAASAASPYFKSRFDYISTTVTAADPDYTGFGRVVLSGTNYPEPIVIERTPETEVSAAGITLHTHTIISPVNVGLNSSVGMEALSAVYGLTASKVADVGDDGDTLAKYGLNDPACAIDITGADEDHSFALRISATDEDGNVYLIKGNSPVIYQLPASTLTWLPLTLFDLMDKLVIVPNIKNVSQVTLATPDKTYVFGLTGEDDDLAITVNGEKFPDAVKEDGSLFESDRNFRQLYQTMLAASYTGETDLAPAAGEKPIASIEYVYKANVGRTGDILEFYAGPTRKTVMVFNGGKPYLGSSVYLDTLIGDAAKATAGQAVKAYIG